MLAESLAVPFRFGDKVRVERSVTHGHFLSPRGLANVVVVWRDPRDLLVSFYHHCYFVNEHANAALVAMMKARRPFEDYEDVRANLPAFIRFVSTTPVSPSFTWPAFARVWAGRPGTVQTSYEALRTDTASELARVAEALSGQPLARDRAAEIAEAHSFARAKAASEAARTAQTEVSFVREGSMGGWRRHFTPEAEAAMLDAGYAESMARLGYSLTTGP